MSEQLMGLDLPSLDGFTPEQADAITRRHGDLLLDAGAGSGKTSVLVERFVRSVLEDGVDVGAILTITFTEKAAAELRERLRARLRALGAADEARATENAYISTIHGFCARVLRANALRAGLDPAFAVLDEPAAGQLADAAFEDALGILAADVKGGVDLVAGYGAAALRNAIRATYAQLRSRGELVPRLPPLPATEAGAIDPTALAAGAIDPIALAAGILRTAASAAAAELAQIENPGVKVGIALERLADVPAILADPRPWPGDLFRIALPGGNGAALSTPVCLAYTEALQSFRRLCEEQAAASIHRLLDRLLQDYGTRYAALKRAASAVDFEDLELLARAVLADAEVGGRYRERFQHVMVDEMQDTNRVQLELIELITDDNLFTVGDAQQSIYGFRHAEVELFEDRGARLEQIGARATLQTNFRSHPRILAALNAAFGTVLGDRFRPLLPGRTDTPVAAGPEPPRVELLIADKGADWDAEALAAPWRLAEARALADRVAELCAGGVPPGDVVVLTRATTDLRAYERALEARGAPTYVIGGRGYWAHPQVIDMVAYLRTLANPWDEEALLTVLHSPIGGVSLDGIVQVTAAARTLKCALWGVVCEPDVDELTAEDRARVTACATLLTRERSLAAWTGVEELIERMLEASGYDLNVLALAGGERRMANIRKLMRLAREHERLAGADLRGFLELVARRAGGPDAGGVRESEAPVESEGLDAVRLMTIHRAKGLEFPVVCVADLGRMPMQSAPVIRIGPDRRIGLRLSEPGSGPPVPALDYEALRVAQQQTDAGEERRLFYVAMTRARERLILSGAARLDRIAADRGPIGWIAPAFLPDLPALLEAGGGVGGVGVSVRFVTPEALCDPMAVAPPGLALAPDATAALPPGLAPAPDPMAALPPGLAPTPDPAPDPDPAPGPEPESESALGALSVHIPDDAPKEAADRQPDLSYSALADYQRCGYRFYAERVLRLPPSAPIQPTVLDAPSRAPVGGAPRPRAERLSAAERGTRVHELLRALDFRRPRIPETEEPMREMLAAFAGSALCARLAAADSVRREEPFAFILDDALVTGAIDVLARERGGLALVVDYKSDALGGRAPAELMDAGYRTQRLIYALVALRSGAAAVEVVHAFLERPDEPVLARYEASEAAGLERQLRALASGVLAGLYAVTETPRRSVCDGCPARDGLCSWPAGMTARETPETLF